MAKISNRKLQERIQWSPDRHVFQQNIIGSKARLKVVNAGRGSGKTAVASYEALKTFLADDKQILIVAPSYGLTERIMEYLTKWINIGFPNLRAGISSRPFPKIITPWNSQIECKSATEPTGILGKRYDLTVLDEASRIPKKVYETYIFPTTSAGGKELIISTPFGKNWFYEKWLKAKEMDGAFHFTSRDNPYFPAEEWERAKGILPEDVFKQEYCAEFLESAASVFRGIRDIVKDDCLKDAEPQHFYIMGVDLGKHQDFTVLSVIDRFNNNLVYFDRFQKIDYAFQKERMIAVAKRYNARIIVDSTVVGEPIREDLERAGLMVDDFKFSNQSKKELIEKLSIFIEQKHVWIPPRMELLDELESFGYEMTEKGNITYSAPTGLHDDCVISLALAVWGLFPGQPMHKTKLDLEIKKGRLPKKQKSFI